MRMNKAWMALMMCFCFGGAKADPIVETFTLTGAGISASGTLTLVTTGTPGVDEITNITGFFSTTNNGGFSGAITGLNPGSYNASSPTIDTLSAWDNLIYTSATAPCYGFGSAPYAALDVCGLDFLVAGGYEVNVFGDPLGTAAAGYLVSDGKTGAYTYVDDNVAANFVATPESATWPLLAVTGFAMCLMMRKRRCPALVQD